MEQLTFNDMLPQNTFQVTYYKINEQLAESSHSMMSMSDYKKGAATAEYKEIIDDLVKFANNLVDKGKVNPDNIPKAQSYLNKMSKFYADYINKDNEIGTRCPSVLISGAGNFPTRKKEKQVAAWDSLHKTYISPDEARHKIYSILTDASISSDDPHAIEKLERRIETLEEQHKAHIQSNKELRQKEGKKCAFEYTGKYYFTDNETAEIRRLKKRLEELKAQSTKESKAEVYDGFSVEYDNTDMRIRFIFDDKPDDETRAILKSNGFHWSRFIGAWQRLWNTNGEYATKRVIESITAQD